jgi:hypothetical protein
MNQKPCAWRVGNSCAIEKLPEVTPDYEQNLETWIEQDPTIIDGDLLLIGRQVQTEFDTVVDLLGIEDAAEILVPFSRPGSHANGLFQVRLARIGDGNDVNLLGCHCLFHIAAAHLARANEGDTDPVVRSEDARIAPAGRPRQGDGRHSSGLHEFFSSHFRISKPTVVGQNLVTESGHGGLGGSCPPAPPGEAAPATSPAPAAS